MNGSVLISSLTFQIICQFHFGWDGEITSDAELICTGITFLILALAFMGENKA